MSAATNRISTPALNRSALNRKRPVRRNSAKAGSARVVIVSAVFVVLFVATLLVGGHAALDPLLQAATQRQDPRGAGAVVYTMPDGIFCRHVSFDNVTAQVNEGPVERCADDFGIAQARARPRQGFAWHNN
jgi:hypothetical protein